MVNISHQFSRFNPDIYNFMEHILYFGRCSKHFFQLFMSMALSICITVHFESLVSIHPYTKKSYGLMAGCVAVHTGLGRLVKCQYGLRCFFFLDLIFIWH